MKIINQKGKLFGVINIVDLLVVLAVIAVAAGIGYKLFATQIADATAEQVAMTVTVRVRGATPFLVEEVQRNSQVGKQMVSGNSYVNATDPSKKDLVFTIETTVAKGTATPTIGTQEVRAGRTLIVKTNDFETTGNIDSVVIADE